MIRLLLTVKAVEEVCVTCGSNHNFNNYPLTRNDFPVFHDNIHQFQQTAAVGNFVQRNPPNLANQMRPPVLNNQMFKTTKKFEEDLLTYCVENGIFQDSQDTFESSDDNTNVVNAPREPIVVNQDPGEKSSQGPPQIDQNCCYECGDSLDGIFCRQCICKSCGKGAHFGYNCPPKDPIISKPEPCNQTINEIPQTLPSLDPSCFSLPHVSKPNLVDDPPNVFNLPPQTLPIVHPTCNYENENSFIYNSKPNSSNDFPNYCEQNSCYYPNSSGFDHPQPPQDSVYCQEALDKILEELEELKRDQHMLKELKKRIAEEHTAKENMSIEEMRHEKQLVDYKIKEITNYLGIKRFRGEKIDEEYERICEITIRKLEQDFNIWGSEVQKNEQAYEEEKYSATRRYMLSIPFVDEDDYIPLGDRDEHLDTIPATESDEVIKSSVETLVPIPSEFEGISDDTCDVPNYDNNHVNIESDLMESLINRDTLIVYSSKIDPILEEFAGELAHIAPIPPGIVEVDFDPNDDTSSDNDDFEDIEYVSLEEVNDVDQEEKEFDLEDIFQIQDVILREKLLNVHRLISNIESLKVNPTPNRVLNSPSPFSIPVADSDSFVEESNTSLSHLDNSLPEFETFSYHTEETRSDSTTTHANYSLPEYDLFLFEIEPDQEGLISIDNSNDPLLELPEFESFYFDEPSFLQPLPEPPDVEKCFEPEAGILITKVFKGVSKPHDFMADILPTLPTLVPDLTFISSFFSFASEDTIFDLGIST
ncbi:hypothetical protein Tco_0916434 [Tanacetum coccineum]